MRKAILILLALLIVLGGVYGYMRYTAPEPVEEDNTATGGEFVLSDIDPMTVMFLRYKLDGQEFRYKYTVYGWKLEEDEDFPLNQDVLEHMVSAMCKVTSDRMLTDDPAAFREYGLDPVHIAVELEDSKGNVYDYNIGTKHPTTSKFYFNVDGEKEIYTVPTLVGRYFENYPTLVSQMNNPHFPSPDPTTVYSFKVEHEGSVKQMVYADEGDPSCYTADYKWFWVEGDEYRPLSDAKMNELLTNIQGMGFIEPVAYSDDPSVLAQYGLTEEQRYTLTVDYNSLESGPSTEIFYVGQGDDGAVYGQLDGKTTVGRFAFGLSAFDPDYDSLRPIDFFRMELDTVDAMHVLLVDQVMVMTAERDGETVDYTDVGGRTLDGGKVTAFFNTLRSITPEGEYTGDVPAGVPYLQIDFDRNTESHANMTLRLWEHDDSYYVSQFNDELRLINKIDIRTLVSALEDAAAPIE